MDNIETNNTSDDQQQTIDRFKINVVLKALHLLQDDLLEDIHTELNLKYFGDTLTNMYLIACKNDADLITIQYLRSIHSVFNNYYIMYQSDVRGQEASPSDKERSFTYRVVNDQLEDIIYNY